MSSNVTFTAPVDLSIGNVRITNATGTVVREWTATQDSRACAADLEPGFYTADITPSGLGSQQVIFEVYAARHNDVTMPPFSSLLASSGTTAFLNVSDQGAALRALFGDGRRAEAPQPLGAPNLLGLLDDDRISADRRDASERGRSTHEGQVVALSGADRDVAQGQETTPQPLVPATIARRLSVGLSREGRSRSESFRGFAGKAGIELSEARLELVVSGEEGWTPDSGERVRLSVAIEDVRVERLLLPMYRGGVQITITPSPLSSSDILLEVLPNDPRLRSLVRSLVAGTSDEAKAVLPVVQRAADIRSAEAFGDPWEAMLSALLSIRFPDEIPPTTAAQADALVANASWAYDSYVIRAHQLLYSVGSEAERAAAAVEALEMLRKAQARGSPYFSYVNQLFAEMADALLGYFDRTSSSQSRKGAAKIRDRWFREQALQSRAGASFSWLARDQALLSSKILAPERRPSGRLGKSATTLFSGYIVDGGIRLDPTHASPPADDQGSAEPPSIAFDDLPAECPALARDPGPDDDPNLGRFGLQDVADGYSLRTRFDEGVGSDEVTITMTVDADTQTTIAPDAIAWFCLHPSFHPQWVKVVFGNGRAILSVRSWGGFTVGVWLPDAQVELEGNLSQHPDAPEIVRDR